MHTAGRSWLRPFLQPLWPTFREVAVLSLFINLLALAVPVFVMQVYDRVVFHAGLATLEGLVIGIIGVLAFDWVLRQSRARILQRVALRLDVTVGRSLFDKVCGAAPRSARVAAGGTLARALPRRGHCSQHAVPRR
jgi:ATP-binding cassette subfamily C protein LapB